MSAIAELSLFPVDKGESVSSHVARAVRIIRKSGLPPTTGPMGTSFEGDIDSVMNLARSCLEELSRDSSRVYMVLKVDWRKGDEYRMEKKIISVQEKTTD